MDGPAGLDLVAASLDASTRFGSIRGEIVRNIGDLGDTFSGQAIGLAARWAENDD